MYWVRACVYVQSAVDALNGGVSDCTACVCVCVQSAVDALTGGASDCAACVCVCVQSAVDAPTGGASGFSDDNSSVYNAAAAGSSTVSHGDSHHSGEFRRMLRDCGMRVSANNASFSHSSRCSSTSSGENHQRSVEHNHTYPLSPGQSSRREREEPAQSNREEHASRCRDEKKAKDMQVCSVCRCVCR